MDFHRRSEFLSTIPKKANRILHIVLLFLLLIGFRVWHLAVIQHDNRVDEAFRSRKRVIVEPPLRGTIRDRFNNILAKNKTEYQLGIIYSQFNEVPLVAYEKRNKEVKKRLLRREYIQALSLLIAKETGEDKERICDLIYSYAPFYGHAPYIIKKGLSESAYYRLKALEKDWPGLRLIRTSKRTYPYGKTASHLLGYLGPIPSHQYQKLMMRVSELSEYIKTTEMSISGSYEIQAVLDAKKELRDLKERFYTLNDAVGAMGVESSFDKDLRGYVGKRIVLSSPKGSIIRELPGSRSPLPGKRLMLTISIELQEHAEKLLALSEKDRSEKLFPDLKEPWTKGGAIVAIDPITGEVVALASYPRFDPNDFSSSNRAFSWIENEQFFSDVWDQKTPLRREFFNDKKNIFLEDEKYLSWNDFLKFALPIGSPTIKLLDEKKPIKEIIKMQAAFDELLKLAPSYTPYEVIDSFFSKDQDINSFGQNATIAKATLSNFFNNLETTKEKLFLIDLSRLILSHDSFSPALFDKIGNTSLETFRKLSSSYCNIKEMVKKEARKLFHEHDFKEWRKSNEKLFLKKIREKETKKKIAHRPYLDYIDKEEKKRFSQFMEKYQYIFHEYVIRKSTELVDKDEKNLLQRYFDHFDNTPELIKSNQILQENIANFDQAELLSFFKSMRSSSELSDPAYGTYKELVRDKNPSIKEIFMAVLRGESAGTMRSHGFRQSTIQGSIFKLVTAYAGLKQRYYETSCQLTRENASPLEIIDKTYKSDGRTFVGTFLDGRKIPQHFKGGRIPKSLSSSIGRVDIVRALETSSNPYFSLLASEILKDPEQLTDAAKDFGYGEKSGIAIPGELKGEVPSDVKSNKTGLYATAIGQHTLVTTPLQTALMISAIANKGMLLTPKITSLIVGRKLPQEDSNDNNEVIKCNLPVRRSIFLPDSIRKILLEGMRCSTMRAYDDANSLAIRYSQQHPQMYKDFMKMKGQMLGKSSTSEVIERMGVNFGSPASMYRHIWFGGISFNNSQPEDHPFVFTDHLGQPELVVVVYLRYAGYGKEAAPLAASVAAKWREIVSKTKLTH